MPVFALPFVLLVTIQVTSLGVRQKAGVPNGVNKAVDAYGRQLEQYRPSGGGEPSATADFLTHPTPG